MRGEGQKGSVELLQGIVYKLCAYVYEYVCAYVDAYFFLCVINTMKALNDRVGVEAFMFIKEK